jgi:hypothetical protein
MTAAFLFKMIVMPQATLRLDRRRMHRRSKADSATHEAGMRDCSDTREMQKMSERVHGSDVWSLTDGERLSVAQQAAAGISSLSFFNGFQISDAVGQEAAKELEAKAYDRAKVEAATTTGSRPKCELL